MIHGWLTLAAIVAAAAVVLRELRLNRAAIESLTTAITGVKRAEHRGQTFMEKMRFRLKRRMQRPMKYVGRGVI